MDFEIPGGLPRYKSDISFRCPACGSDVEEAIAVSETNWSGDNADERFVQDNDAVQCDDCSAWFDIEINNQDGDITVRLDDYPDVDVYASDAELSDPETERIEWIIDYATEPHKELEAALLEIERLVREHGTNTSVTTMNRMLFSQQVAAMEAYLGDTLLNTVMSDDERMAALLAKEEELKEMKIPLSAYHADGNVVKVKVGEHIRNLLFHNLPKTENIYRLLQIELFSDRDTKKRLNKAMALRHDCVHHNGKTKAGEALTEITKDFVLQNSRDIRSVAEFIEGQV